MSLHRKGNVIVQNMYNDIAFSDWSFWSGRSRQLATFRPGISELEVVMPVEPKNDLVRLAKAPNPAVAHIWQNALQEEGIRCEVLGDFLEAGFGDISGLSAELWVEPTDAARAGEILRSHEHHAEEKKPETT